MEHVRSAEGEGTGISVMVSKVATVQGEGAQAAKRYGFFLKSCGHASLQERKHGT